MFLDQVHWHENVLLKHVSYMKVVVFIFKFNRNLFLVKFTGTNMYHEAMKG